VSDFRDVTTPELTITKAQLLAWCDRELEGIAALVKDADARLNPRACREFYSMLDLRYRVVRFEIETDQPWRGR